MFQVGVYHMTTAGFRSGLDMAGRLANSDIDAAAEKILAAISENQYVLCAQVEARDLEHAYHLTNNTTEDGWVLGEGVVFAAHHKNKMGIQQENSQRSSMVGDIFMIDGDAHICASFGFEKLPQAVANRLNSSAKQGTAFDDAL